MSWNSYTDNIVASQKLDQAAIYGIDGSSQWAVTGNLALSAAEIQSIVAGFADPSTIQANGVHAQSEKYFCIKADSDSIYGKKGEDGIYAVKTKQAIIIGHSKAPIQAPAAAAVVEKMADYLRSVGY
ncbi:profilin [Martiniozyma asiatica (nom. inval.)]|nr:profilin [Martiniozyma asiatica]